MIGGLLRGVKGTLIGFACLGLSAFPALALTSNASFDQFKHVRWTADEGAPVGNGEIAQTPDGYLWIASDALFRFDGVTFERIAAPSGSRQETALPIALFVSRSGELWVGYRGGAGVAVYRKGRLVDTQMPAPPVSIGRLFQTPDGVIWATSSLFEKRLWRYSAGQWSQVDQILGLPPGAVMGAQVSADGGLRVMLSKRDDKGGSLAYLPPGGRRFQEFPTRFSSRATTAVGPDGALWVSDAGGTRMLLDRAGRSVARTAVFSPIPNSRVTKFAFDRAGNIWGAAEGEGIFYIHAPGTAPPRAGLKVERFGAIDGLTSDTAYIPFVDREGSVWFATELGIDQFRPASATRSLDIPADPTVGLGLDVSPDGWVYVLSRATIFGIAPGQRPRPVVKTAPGVASVCAARDGGVWVVQEAHVFRIRQDRSSRQPGYPHKGEPIDCAEDRWGRLWVGFPDGLIWRDASGWHTPERDFGKAGLWRMIATPEGNVAFTTPRDLGQIEGDRFTMTKGAGAGQIMAGTRDVFLGGSSGLIRLRGGQIAKLEAKRFPWLASVRTLVQTPGGETWVIRRTEISRVSTHDFDRAFDHPGSQLERQIFNSHDGLQTTVQHSGFSGTQAGVGGDGRVWFLTREGASVIDPPQLKLNKLPPPVAVRSLSAGGRVYVDPSDITLPPGTHALDISYAGLSLAVPGRVRFRYKLEGVDDDWVDPGPRRLAGYSNLGPGRYQFRVLATNNDGVWSPEPATLTFTIPPTFLQSIWFKLLCALAVILLATLAYRLRLRRVTARLQSDFDTRVAERERIARELHDTLLQGFQGLMMSFQAVANRVPKEGGVRQDLDEALDQAETVLVDGRARVRDLRGPAASLDLDEAIANAAAALRGAYGPTISVQVEGQRRRLHQLVREETLAITTEAIRNAVQHAQGSRIDVLLRYAPREFVLEVTDDGVGLPEAVMAQGGRDGHFGLVGMRERAARIDGGFTMASGADGGTIVTLVLPERAAYAERQGWFGGFL